MSQKGQLYLIPTRLGDQPPLEVLPLSTRKKITDINHYIVENEKVARRFIKKIVPSKSQDKLNINLLNKFTQDIEIPEFLKPCEDGLDIGLMTDAGCPGVADPGSKVVNLAHRQSIKVVPLVGPSSIILALMASGLNGQNFAFNGYLPIDKGECKKRIKQLEKHAETNNQSQIFIETPYRNGQLFETFLKTLKPHTQLCVAVDLTLNTEFILTKSVSAWQNEEPDWHKRPAIFIFQPEF
mgnify:CR=1 FL=1